MTEPMTILLYLFTSREKNGEHLHNPFRPSWFDDTPKNAMDGPTTLRKYMGDSLEKPRRASILSEDNITKDPFQSCLVGLPWDIHRFRHVKGLLPSSDVAKITGHWDIIKEFNAWIQSLPILPYNPHDVHLLTSSLPDICINFSPPIEPHLSGPRLSHRPHHKSVSLSSISIIHPPPTDLTPLNASLYGPH